MTTNNHPAHGPVSLDRLHQISEILSKAAVQSDGGNLGYAMSDAVKVINGVIAAFGAEPVGYFYAEKPGDWYQISDGDKVPAHRRIPLYSSPQSGQVVKLPNEFISNEGIVVQIEKVMAVLAVAGIQYERKGNACHAAILQSFGNSEQLNSPATSDCWCRTCRPVTMSDMRFVVCPDCGNKRCPHANDHRNACTGSNEPGQIGSAYPAAPQQEVK
ncbi:hypothetical protein DTG47_12075 [Salmonella enterica subsp. enterica]|uniref:hypothetical protein n=1 Tax=Salmonella enterica TaxID=28901 RepID=UPI000F95BEF1|nr:hypothetical protein [Salmonella enterica]ECK0490641.1 hypothetical protein [Salmonella enterica subsp. enterica serovar Saintpaul]EFR5246715.1 hypothetical protein [Salmonella enterica subsp. enterica serovar Infantis]EAB7141302.1 hypothetical protein [Salmonella enterica subsp. enterica serovar Heidelberg]EAB7745000.1 hypothetical protein [Salmonella enterica subsp. enterica serovar Heidelberg]EBC9745279.1 hypothetical protein [Salmonella enterica subsp. enterica serovar Heidelberg]